MIKKISLIFMLLGCFFQQQFCKTLYIFLHLRSPCGCAVITVGFEKIGGDEFGPFCSISMLSKFLRFLSKSIGKKEWGYRDTRIPEINRFLYPFLMAHCVNYSFFRDYLLHKFLYHSNY